MAYGALGLAQDFGIGAAAFLRRGVGARALGMGGAFVSIADNYSALYWNPAGLARIPAAQVGGSSSDLFGVGIYHNFIAGALPFVINTQTPSLQIGLGAGYTEMTAEVQVVSPGGQSVGMIQYAERLITVGIGLRLPNRLSLGATVKMYSFLAPKAGVDGGDASALGFGIDLGVLAPLSPNLWLGLAAADVGNTRLKWHNTPTEPTDLVMGRYTVGVAFVQDDLVLAVDYVHEALGEGFVRAGVEYSLGFLALRAGVTKRTRGPWAFSAGAGVEVGDLGFDVAWVQNKEIEAEGARDTVVFSAFWEFKPLGEE
jgi:hypothetical protein